METKQYSALPILGAVLLLCTREEGRNDWLYNSLRPGLKAMGYKYSLVQSKTQSSVISVVETSGVRGLVAFRWLEEPWGNPSIRDYHCFGTLSQISRVGITKFQNTEEWYL